MTAMTRDLTDTLRNRGLEYFRCDDEHAQHSIIGALRGAIERATQEGYAPELMTSRRNQDCFSAELDGSDLRNAFVKQPISLTDITAEGQAFHTLMKHVYDLTGYGECIMTSLAVGNVRPRLTIQEMIGDQGRRRHR